MKFTISISFFALAAFSAPPAQDFNSLDLPFAPQFDTASLGELPQFNFQNFGAPQFLAEASNSVENKQVPSIEAPTTPKSQEAGSFNFLGYEAPMYSEAGLARDSNRMGAMSADWELQDINIDNFAI